MKAYLKVLLPIVLAISMVAIYTSPSVATEEGTILIDISHGSYHTSYEWFKGNWTAKGYTVEVNNGTFQLDEHIEALLLPGPEVAYNESEVQAILDWYSTGGKFIWIAGDSDYGGYFLSNDSVNPLLDALGANLRVARDAVDDTVSNDGASYRVIANQPGTDPVAKVLTNGVSKAVFHGPTSVLGWSDDGKVVDLRDSTIEGKNISVVMKSSKDATAIDQDISLDPVFDYYSVTAKDKTGSYPMLVAQFFDNNNMLVVSGESIFADYKNMYGLTTEHGGDHDGKTLVDNIITYAMALEEPSKEGGFLPGFTTYTALAGILATVAIYVRRRK